jgi:hypothetical protein
MTHDIRVIRLRDFLRTDLQGHIDLESSKEALRDVARSCAENHNHHVLIDTRDTTTTATVMDVWDLASSLEDCGIGRTNRIAILNAPKDNFDRAAFLETCAANRGFNIRAFRDFESALYWLADDSRKE